MRLLMLGRYGDLCSAFDNLSGFLCRGRAEHHQSVSNQARNLATAPVRHLPHQEKVQPVAGRIRREREPAGLVTLVPGGFEARALRGGEKLLKAFYFGGAAGTKIPAGL